MKRAAGAGRASYTGEQAQSEQTAGQTNEIQVDWKAKVRSAIIGVQGTLGGRAVAG